MALGAEGWAQDMNPDRVYNADDKVRRQVQVGLIDVRYLAQGRFRCQRRDCQ